MKGGGGRLKMRGGQWLKELEGRVVNDSDSSAHRPETGFPKTARTREPRTCTRALRT